MKPIRETVEAVEELGPFEYDDRLLEDLEDLAAQVRTVVPDCVGLSWAVRDHDVTFTLVATDAEIAALDAVQYVDGGPCVEAAERGETVVFTDDDVVDESRWSLFAQLTAHHGVGSSLTLPVVIDDHVTSTYNLYAVSQHAFDGHADELAVILDAWSAGAVTDADLSFATRRRAESAPRNLRADPTIDLAVRVLAKWHRTDTARARDNLEQAALRAGISLHQFSLALVHLRI